MTEAKAEYTVGRIDYSKSCAFCGDSVSVDVRGRCLCFACGKFVDTVPAILAPTLHGNDVQIPLFKNGWGMPG
jgi:hypothetical protein